MGLENRVAILIAHIRGLITLLITTHEPPSRVDRERKKPTSLRNYTHRNHVKEP